MKRKLLFWSLAMSVAAFGLGYYHHRQTLAKRAAGAEWMAYLQGPVADSLDALSQAKARDQALGLELAAQKGKAWRGSSPRLAARLEACVAAQEALAQAFPTARGAKRQAWASCLAEARADLFKQMSLSRADYLEANALIYSLGER